ncbi:hypothetical protein RHGRI_011469 [Rhododendron griersonianum]|uniref:SWIM-type domain-containing protein n=1 Tax=Rhododendron griersonianum TaxID=479676 RepID=A0AAV6KLW7_9ERIC|nr:hypothetical protein RHGRI_011469 [Rhododendron griersonianum]
MVPPAVPTASPSNDPDSIQTSNPGAMDTPNRSTNNKAVQVDSYDWESNSNSDSASGRSSRKDYHSNTYGENDVDGEGEGEGSVSNVDDEIQRTSALIVGRCVNEVERWLYFIERYSHPESNWTVEYYPIDSRINCSCLIFESFGLPCYHMIVVIKYEHLSTIPPSLVMRRWTRSCRPPAQQPIVGQISRSISHTARYGILSSGYKLMSFYASHAQDSFEDARQVEHEMTSWMRKRWEMGKNKECNTEIGEPSDGQTLFGVADPPVVKTKGNPGKKNSTTQHFEIRGNVATATAEHIAIMSTKRKIPYSASSPHLRRSKRLAALSVDQSTDGRDDDEMNVRSGGDYEEMTNSFSHANNESDGENDGETESDAKSDGESEGAIKLPTLSNFVSRPWNVKPKSPRRKLNANQAMLLHAVYNGFKPDIDKFGKEVTVIGHGTIGKSEGQSKLHRKAKSPTTLEDIHELLEAVLENQFDIYAKLKKVVCTLCSPSHPSHVYEDASTFDDE